MSSILIVHVYRALLTAAVTWVSDSDIGDTGGIQEARHTIDNNPFDAIEICLVGAFISHHSFSGQLFGEDTSTSVAHIHRLIGLPGRSSRWGFLESLSSVLYAALESDQLGT